MTTTRALLFCILWMVANDDGSRLTMAMSTNHHPGKNVEIGVEMWTEDGRVVRKNGDNNDPPRYLVGKVTSRSSSKSCFSHFTFDLGNPGDSTFLVQHCLGCENAKNTTDACPLSLPSCNNDDNENTCWPSRPKEYLSWDCFQEASIDTFPCKTEISKNEQQHRICLMCFDHGNHSRYYIPSLITQNLTIIQNEDHHHYYSLPSSFQFGALIRTIPQQDRIWSNVGIGYNSSFFRQTGFSSLQFSLHNHHQQKIIFNPSIPTVNHNDIFSQPYTTPHQRVHHIDGFRLGDSNILIHGKTTTIVSNNMNHLDDERIMPMKFFMDTGNGGISLADPVLRYQLAKATGGYWTHDENGFASDSQQLIIPTTDNSNIPDLHIIFTPGVQVTMKGHMWNKNGKTIFVSTHISESILGLPFISCGLDLIFDDKHKTLYLMGDNVKKITATENNSIISQQSSSKDMDMKKALRR